MVWLAILLVPILNSKMMSEVHVSLSNIPDRMAADRPPICSSSSSTTPSSCATSSATSTCVTSSSTCSSSRRSSTASTCSTAYWATSPRRSISSAPNTRRSPTCPSTGTSCWDSSVTCANTAIKMMYQSLRDEQAMEELKRQNLQAEMDYLKYQINPHFFMRHA